MNTAFDLGQKTIPQYQAIASELAQTIRNGQLAAGEKLPPHRVLTHRLGVTTGTVSRAYASLERLALARSALAGIEFRWNHHHPHLWLPLPNPWRAGLFAATLRHAGVLVRTADQFAAGRTPSGFGR